MELSISINKKNNMKCFHLILKSVIDEISSVISTNLGMIIKDMSKNLNKIIPEGASSLTMKQLTDLFVYMENLEKKFKSAKGLIGFIKATKLDPDNNYQSIIKLKDRREKFEEILELKNLFDINYFSRFFGRNFRYFDPTDDFIDFKIKSEFEEIINEIFKGTRTKRNTFDKIHLYSCCVFSRNNRSDELKFTTTDNTLIKGANLIEDYFQILRMESLIRFLNQKLKALPSPK